MSKPMATVLDPCLAKHYCYRTTKQADNTQQITQQQCLERKQKYGVAGCKKCKYLFRPEVNDA